MDVPPPSGRCLPSVSQVLARLEFDWGYTVYIRLDLQGYFHTYPDLGGPYRSLQEADKAIDRHLDELRDPKIAHSKASDDSDNTSSIFFVEVKHLNRGKHREVYVCHFCILNPLDEGQHCNACTFHEDLGMKHPDSSVKLATGHLDPRSQFGGLVEDKEWNDSEDEDACLRDAEAELRETFKGLDDPHVLEKLFTLPPGVTIVQN